jgi:hypothetical protein
MVFKRRIINVFIKLFANKKWLKSSISTINFIGRDDTRKLFFYDLRHHDGFSTNFAPAIYRSLHFNKATTDR